MRELVAHTVGGGWGSDEPTEPTDTATAIVRGADFPDVERGSLSHLPIRYEPAARVAARRLQPGDVVLEISGGTADRPTGRSVYFTEELLSQVDIPIIPASFCRLLRFNEKHIDSRYASYWLREMYERGRTWEYQNQSTGLSNFQFQYFLDTEMVTLPPLTMQAAISRVLGLLDDKIGLNHKIVSIVQEIARSIFKSWFVDFDPVRGTASLPDDIQRLFPNQLVDSQSGPIPKGWDLLQLGDVVNINARTLRATELPQSILYVDISSASEGEASATALPREDAPSRARRGVQHGDTIVSTVRPERGAHFLALHPPERLIVSTGFATLTPASVPWSFLYAAVCRPEVFERLGALASGAAYPAVRPATIAAMPIVLPQQDLSNTYHAIAAPLLERATLASQESSALNDLRDKLLPKLLSGDVRLSAG